MISYFKNINAKLLLLLISGLLDNEKYFYVLLFTGLMNLGKYKKEFFNFIYYDDTRTEENLAELIYQQLIKFKLFDKILLLLLIILAV